MQIEHDDHFAFINPCLRSILINTVWRTSNYFCVGRWTFNRHWL